MVLLQTLPLSRCVKVLLRTLQSSCVEVFEKAVPFTVVKVCKGVDKKPAQCPGALRYSGKLYRLLKVLTKALPLSRWMNINCRALSFGEEPQSAYTVTLMPFSLPSSVNPICANTSDMLITR